MSNWKKSPFRSTSTLREGRVVRLLKAHRRHFFNMNSPGKGSAQSFEVADNEDEGNQYFGDFFFMLNADLLNGREKIEELEMKFENMTITIDDQSTEIRSYVEAQRNHNATALE